MARYLPKGIIYPIPIGISSESTASYVLYTLTIYSQSPNLAANISGEMALTLSIVMLRKQAVASLYSGNGDYP